MKYVIFIVYSTSCLYKFVSIILLFKIYIYNIFKMSIIFNIIFNNFSMKRIT